MIYIAHVAEWEPYNLHDLQYSSTYVLLYSIQILHNIS